MLKYGHTETSYTDYYGFAAGVHRMAEHGYHGVDYQEFIDTATPLFEKNHEFEQYLPEQKKLLVEKIQYIARLTSGKE